MSFFDELIAVRVPKNIPEGIFKGLFLGRCIMAPYDWFSLQEGDKRSNFIISGYLFLVALGAMCGLLNCLVREERVMYRPR